MGLRKGPAGVPVGSLAGPEKYLIRQKTPKPFFIVRPPQKKVVDCDPKECKAPLSVIGYMFYCGTPERRYRLLPLISPLETSRPLDFSPKQAPNLGNGEILESPPPPWFW